MPTYPRGLRSESGVEAEHIFLGINSPSKSGDILGREHDSFTFEVSTATIGTIRHWIGGELYTG